MSRPIHTIDENGHEYIMDSDTGQEIVQSSKRGQAQLIITKLNDIAREAGSEYGLPGYDDWHMDRMVNAVLDIIDPRQSLSIGVDV